MKIAEPIIYDDAYGFENEPRKYTETVHILRADRQGLKVIEPIIYDDYNGRIRADQDCIGTLTTNCGNDALRNGVKIIEPRIAAMRGRNPDNPSDRTEGRPTEQRLEIDSEETSNTLTTVQKDNLVVEAKEKYIGCAVHPLSKKLEFDGYKDTVCPTLLATDYKCPKTVAYEVETQYRIRKLTERECFRLQGVKEEDFERVAKNQSTSALYHEAGDSICSTCLMAIFGELFDCDYQEKINSLVEELRK